MRTTCQHNPPGLEWISRQLTCITCEPWKVAPRLLAWHGDFFKVTVRLGSTYPGAG